MINDTNNLAVWINKQAACWKGYEQVGTKMLDGREVPNCVPASKSIPNSKPKKKKTEKESADKWQRALAGILAGGIGGKLIGGTLGSIDMSGDFPTSLDDFNFNRVGKEWSSGGSAAGGLLGALLGGGIGYATADDDDSKETKPKKKKTEKKSEAFEKQSISNSKFEKLKKKLLEKYDKSVAKDYDELDQQFAKEIAEYLAKNPLPSATSSALMGLTGLVGGGLLGVGAGNLIDKGELSLGPTDSGYVGAGIGGVLGALVPSTYYKLKDWYYVSKIEDKFREAYKQKGNIHGEEYVKQLNKLLKKNKQYEGVEAKWQPIELTAGLVAKKSNDMGLNVSDYIADAPIKCTPGVGCKRMLSPGEEAEIEAAKGNMFPNLYPQNPDPVSSLISSPGWAGIGTGLLGAAGLGGVVGLGAHLTNKDALTYGALAAAAGGLGGGLYGYIRKALKNKEIAALIENLPVGADIGDIEIYSDPKIRAAISRDFQRQLMRKNLV
jgi:hypothetical protein